MSKTGENTTDTLLKIERRALLSAAGGVFGAIAASRALGLNDASAQQVESGLNNRDLSQEDLQGEPWIADKQGNFDLSDPVENRLATFKISNNLIGRKTYIAMFSRALLGPQGIGGAPLYGHIGLWTWQLQKARKDQYPDAPEGTIVQRALFTGMILDPFTYEPVKSVHNAYLGKDVEVADSLFSESYLFYPFGGGVSIDRPEFMADDPEAKSNMRPFVRWGDDIALMLDGIFQNKGPHQPRMDTSIWTTPFNQLNDPGVGLVNTDYNFAGLLRAWERPWIGVGKDDDAQLLWNVKGTKHHSVDDFPSLIKDNIVAKYPDRV